VVLIFGGRFMVGVHPFLCLFCWDWAQGDGLKWISHLKIKNRVLSEAGA